MRLLYLTCTFIVSFIPTVFLSKSHGKYHNATQSIKIGRIKKRSQNGDTLTEFLESNDKISIEVDSEKLLFSFDGLTVKDVADDHSSFKFDLISDVTLGGVMKVRSGSEISASYEEFGLQKGYTLAFVGNGDFDDTQAFFQFRLFISSGYQDLFFQVHFLETRYPLDDYITLLGFENREAVMNLDGLDTSLIDDDEGFFAGRISYDGSWNYLITPNIMDMDNGMICSKFGEGESMVTACAFFAVFEEDDFKTFMRSYAPTLPIDKTPLPSKNIVLLSTKQTFKYRDYDSPMQMKISAEKKDEEYIFSDIEGGSDFFFIKFTTNFMSIYIDRTVYRNLLFDCKLSRNKFEMKLHPVTPIAGNTILGLARGNLYQFFSTHFDSTTVLLEKYEMFPDEKICITIKHAVAHEMIAEKYVIKDTVMQFCDEAGVLRFESQYNQEINFGAKMRMNIESDPNGGKMKVSGEVTILDANTLWEQIGHSFLSTEYEEVFGHLKQFPINTLSHAHKLGSNYLRFDGVCLLNEIEFKLQAVYIFSGQPASPLALCLEKKQMTTNDEGEEVAAPSIRFADFVEYVFDEKNLGIGSVTKFKELKLSFQQNHQFYDSLQSDDALWCSTLASTVIAQEEFGTDFPHIFMSAGKTDYQCTGGSEGDRRLCTYLKTALGYQGSLYAYDSYLGYMKTNEFKLHSKFPLRKTFTITSGLSVEGIDESAKPMTQTISWKKFTDETDQEKRGNIIKGYLTKYNVRDSLRMQADLQILEDKIFFSVSEVPDPRPETGFLGIAYVNEYIIRSIRHEVQREGDIYLIFHSDLKIGSVAASAIEIRNENGRTGQYLYGDASKNKLFACMFQREELPLTRVFEAFGFALTHDMFTPLVLTHVCFTYIAEGTWDIESEGIQAEQGLWIHAKTKVPAKNAYGVSQEFLVDFRMKCTGDNRQIFFEQPPLFFYPIPEKQRGPTDEVEEEVEEAAGTASRPVQEKNYKVSIINSKTAKDTGPTLEVTLNGNAVSQASLNGYVSTIAFEAPVEFTVDPITFETLEFLQSGKKSKKRTTSNPLLGTGFSLRGVWRKGNSFQDSTFEFRFNGNLLATPIKSSYRTLVQAKKDFQTGKKDNHETMMGDIETKLENPAKKANKKSELNKLLREIQYMKRTLHFHEKRKLLACSRSCKAIKSPGFKWEKCQVSERLGNVSCLHFKRDAHKSCDMPCIAACEVARVDADEQSNKIFKQINAKARSLEKRTIQGAIYNELLEEVEAAKTAFETSISLFNTDYNTFNSIGDYFPISTLSTEWVDFDDFDKSTKLDFQLTYNSGDEETFTSVVDGSLPTRLAEYYLNKLHESKLDNLARKEENVQKRYYEVLQIISDWKIKNRDQILKDKRRRPAAKKSKSKKKKSKNEQEKSRNRRTAAFEDIRVYKNPSSLYHEDKLSSNQMIRALAPWNALRTLNPFVGIKNKPVNIAKRLQISKSKSPCTNRRNRIRDYKDILAYMTTWSNAFEQAGDYMTKSQKEISVGLKGMETQINSIATRSPNSLPGSPNSTMKSRINEVQRRWLNRLTTGFDSWQSEFRNQLNNFYTIGPKLMSREINAIFTPNGFDNFQQYANGQGSSDLRSLSNDIAIQQLNQYFVTGLSKMGTLDKNRGFINQMSLMIQQVEKQGCHDEL